MSAPWHEDDDEDEDAVMQWRCVHCKAEQYAPAVAAVSHGAAPCMWCNTMSEPMTIEEYRAALAA